LDEVRGNADLSQLRGQTYDISATSHIYRPSETGQYQATQSLNALKDETGSQLKRLPQYELRTRKIEEYDLDEKLSEGYKEELRVLEDRYSVRDIGKVGKAESETYIGDGQQRGSDPFPRQETLHEAISKKCEYQGQLISQAQSLRRKQLANADLEGDADEQQRGTSPQLYDRLQTLKTYKDETRKLESLPLRGQNSLHFTGTYGADEAIQN